MASTSGTPPTGGKIGGSSSADEMLVAGINQLIGKGMWRIADTERVRALLRPLNNQVHTRLFIEALPISAAVIIANMPMALVGNSPMMAGIVKDIVMDSTKTFVEIVRQAGHATVADAVDAVGSAIDTAMSGEVAVDPLGHFHKVGCARLALIKPQQPPRPEKKDKQGNVIPAPPLPPPFPKLTLEDALQQKLQASPCCHASFEPASDTSGAAKTKKRRSVMEIIGSIKNPELRQPFAAWYQSLSPDLRKVADKGLLEMDSEEEFVGFMAMPPEMRIEMLPLLAERNPLHTLADLATKLGLIGGQGAKTVTDHVVAFDRSLAPKVAALEAKRAARQQARQTAPTTPPAPAKVEPWWKMFFPF